MLLVESLERSSILDECPEVSLDIIERDRPFLLEACNMAHTQELISNATGIGFEQSPFHKGHAFREEHGSPHRLICEATERWISLGMDELECFGQAVEEFTPELVARSILNWAERNLNYIFVGRLRNTREVEHSAFHRVSALIYQSLLLYEELGNMGATRDMDTYRLALIIALKSKMCRINQNEKVTDYAILMAAFGIWPDIEPTKYSNIFRRSGVTNFQNRIDAVQEQAHLVQAYLTMPEDRRAFLKSIRIAGKGRENPLTYNDLFCAYMGINQEQQRESFADLGKRTALVWSVYQQRWIHIVQYVLNTYVPDRFAHNRLEELEVWCDSEPDELPIWEVGPVLGLRRGGADITATSFMEIQGYYLLKTAEEKSRFFERLASNDQWKGIFAFEAEHSFYCRLLKFYIEELRKVMQQKGLSLNTVYRSVSELEYAYLGHQFAECGVSINLPGDAGFESKGFDFGTVSRLLATMTGGTTSEHVIGARCGLLHRDRLISIAALNDPTLLRPRWDMFVSGIRRNVDYNELARILGVARSSITCMSDILVVEALCMGISGIHAEAMARILNVKQQDILDLKVLDRNDPKYFDKVANAFNYVWKALFNFTRARVDKRGLRKRERVAQLIAVDVLKNGGKLRVVELILYAKAIGLSGRELVHLITGDKEHIYNQTMYTSVTEPMKYLLSRPQSRRRRS